MAMTTRRTPTLRYEREVWRSGAGLLAAIDEVGRGALAGPVSVGVVLLAPDTKPAPFGVADSKLLTPQARQRLVPRIRRWALDCAVGHASAAEIDRIGIIAALRLAAERAVSQLSTTPDWVLLDGNHNYLIPREQPGLFEVDDRAGFAVGVPPEPERWRCQVPVRTLIKGDLRCSSVAAASVLAKTERDALLVELSRDYPQYGFDENKAYSSPRHLAALVEHGPCAVHRCSWNLPGVGRLDLDDTDPDDGDLDETELGGTDPDGADRAAADDLNGQTWPDGDEPPAPTETRSFPADWVMGDDGQMTAAGAAR